MSTRTPIRSRASVVRTLSLLTVWSVAAIAVAQDSPEFGEEEAPAADAEAMEAPMEEPSQPMSDEPTPSSDAGPSMEDRGYSSTAPEAAAAAVVEEDDAPMLKVSVDLGLFADGSNDTEGSRLTLSPVFGVGLAVTDSIDFGVALGLAFQSDGLPDTAMMQSTESAFVVSNPVLTLSHHETSGHTQMSFGGGVTFPLATLPDADEDKAIAASAYAHGSALRGSMNPWMWTPSRASGLLQFAGQTVMDELLVGGEVAVAMLIPTVGTEMGKSADAAAAGQLAAELGYAPEDLKVVLRVQMVSLVNPSQEDPFQFSLDPYVSWQLNETLALNGHLTINLDNPAGVEGAGIWALRVGANLAL